MSHVASLIVGLPACRKHFVLVVGASIEPSGGGGVVAIGMCEPPPTPHKPQLVPSPLSSHMKNAQGAH